MTDRYFPNTVPTASELMLIMLVRYVTDDDDDSTGEDFCLVKARNWQLETVSKDDSVEVPIAYSKHLKHFLWRQLAFIEVYNRATKQLIDIAPRLRPLLQKYILYMDGMLEGLLTTARKHQGDPGYRSRLFDTYLVVEYFVARHEYDVVGRWRANNPDTILECQDAFALGKFSAIRDYSRRSTVDFTQIGLNSTRA